MRHPKGLADEALAYWKRNAPLCAAMGTLTDADRDTFAVLCEVYAALQQARTSNKGTFQVVCLVKQFTQLANAFGLTPASRKKLKIDNQQQQEPPDEFGN